MSDHDLDTLLGGFAADTLTPEEKARLYSAALHDQQLFDALADEQVLKELLDDPAVRRQLLQALNQIGTGAPVTWFDWFRRPSGVAWAGGLAAAVIAVILGTKIYQDSLQHASQSVTTEEPRLSAPAKQAPARSQPKPSSIPDQTAIPPPHEPLAENVTKNNVPLGQVMKRGQAPAPASREHRASDNLAGLEKRIRDQDRPVSQTDSLSADLDMATPHISPSPRQQQVPGAPASSASPPAPVPTPSEAGKPAAIAPITGARALFYGHTNRGTASDMRKTEQEPPLTSMAESAPQAGQLERREPGLPQQSPIPETVTLTRPLGLRYSFMIQKTDGQNHEVTSVPSGYRGPVRLTVESNQEVSLQIWLTGPSRPRQRVVPQEDATQTELKLSAGQRESVLLPLASQSTTMIARVSRISLAPTFDQAASLMADRTPDLLQELVTTDAEAPHQENAIYVVHQDASVNQLAVSIPVPTP